MPPTRPALAPQPAVPALLELFATRPLVALGEMHGCQEEGDFVNALLHHPDFPSTVQVIVVEFGTARHQAVVDRFVAGEPVAARDLRRVWREFIGWGFDNPMYEQFFRTVRAVNRTRPPGQQLRVLLADPPLDWTETRLSEQAEITTVMQQRDEHFAALVESQVLAAGLNGLLIAGQGHFIREWAMPNMPEVHNAVQLLERRHPGCAHVVFTHAGFGPETSALEPHLADWPIPSLVSLHNTWLGELDAGLHFANFMPAGAEPPPIKPGFTLGHMADSYLYLGPKRSLTKSTINPAVYRGDEQYLSYLQRRERLGPFTVDSLLTEDDPRYFPD